VNPYMMSEFAAAPVGLARTCCEAAPDDGIPAGSLGSADVLFKGFADPTRLRLLSVLAAGELCVCDLVDILQVAQPTVSRHLAYLRRSGLVTATRDRKFAHYQLAPARDAVHAALIGCVTSCFHGIPALDRERALAESRVAARRRTPCD
jgi:ArsR family transcriptional regulator, arsenate/arsenite/antimonite-responsive transcriptional repressor